MDTGVIHYLAMVNMIVAAFNPVPALPWMAGACCAPLWYLKGDLRSATRIAVRSGAGFGLGLIVPGAPAFIRGNFIGRRQKGQS